MRSSAEKNLSKDGAQLQSMQRGDSHFYSKHMRFIIWVYLERGAEEIRKSVAAFGFAQPPQKGVRLLHASRPGVRKPTLPFSTPPPTLWVGMYRTFLPKSQSPLSLLQPRHGIPPWTHKRLKSIRDLSSPKQESPPLAFVFDIVRYSPKTYRETWNSMKI